MRSDTLTYDLSRTRQTFLGFGAQIWAYPSSDAYPDLERHRESVLRDLNMRWVRLENVMSGAPWDAMQRTRAMTDALVIAWVFESWGAPKTLTDDDG